MDTFAIHKDFRALKRLNFKLSSLEDVYKNRSIQNSVQISQKIFENLSIHTMLIDGYQKTPLSVKVIRPTSSSTNDLPCILLYHGGGFTLGLTESHHRMACDFAKELQCVVLLPDYRLAPEYRFPWAAEDAYATLLWAFTQAQTIGIDPKRIAVVGESAGGNLAAATTLMARKRNGPAIACQLLLYPALDSRQNTPSALLFENTPMFYSSANKFMWEQYLPQDLGSISEFASPALAESLENLPPAYIETAEFDPLRDEGIEYAQKLKTSKVSCDLYETVGTVHCFDLIRRSSIVKACFEKRFEFLKQYL